MKKILFVFKVLLLSVLLSSLLGCVAFSFSRLTEPHTARTLGKGNNEVELSSGSFGGVEDKDSLQSFFVPLFSPSLEYTRGLSDNFDLAVFIETQYVGRIPLIGLEGKYQLTRKEKHTLSLLFGVGINKGINEYSEYAYNAEKYDDEMEYKKIANDLLLGYFSYIGPVYSFKPNKHYELALNLRVNQSYSQMAPRTSNEINQVMNANIEKVLEKVLGEVLLKVFTLGTYDPGELELEDIKYSAIKASVSFLYGSANTSHTWWIVPSFGTTVSVGVLYPFFVLSKGNKSDEFDDEFDDELKLVTKLGLNFHFNF